MEDGVCVFDLKISYENNSGGAISSYVMPVQHVGYASQNYKRCSLQ